MEDQSERAKFFMSEGRRQMHDPDFVLKNSGLAEGMVVADLGCGPGFFTVPIAQKIGAKGFVYAVDGNQLMLDNLKDNIVKSGVNPKNVEIIRADVSKTGIPENSVDLVFFANVLHEVYDKKAFFKEVRRIAKPNGVVVDVDWKRIQSERGPPLEERLSEEQASKLLFENGFSVLEQIDVGPYHYMLVCEQKSSL